MSDLLYINFQFKWLLMWEQNPLLLVYKFEHIYYTTLDPQIPTRSWWLLVTTSPTNHKPANFWKFWKPFFLHWKETWESGVIAYWSNKENPHRLSRGWLIYKYIHQVSTKFFDQVIYIEFLASHFKDLSRFYRMGDNRRTVNTSTTPYISDQSGTENTCTAQ